MISVETAPTFVERSIPFEVTTLPAMFFDIGLTRSLPGDASMQTEVYASVQYAHNQAGIVYAGRAAVNVEVRGKNGAIKSVKAVEVSEYENGHLVFSSAGINNNEAEQYLAGIQSNGETVDGKAALREAIISFARNQQENVYSGEKV